MALGFFDGCHLGHRSILETALELGGDRAGVFTFPEHPSRILPGRQPPLLITDSEERIELLSGFGLQVLLRAFDRDFSNWSAERFVRELLVETLGVAHVVVGRNYRFGHRAAGDVKRLEAWGNEFGFQTAVCPPVVHQAGEPFIISSTRIRQAIGEGEVALARRLLGRPFEVTGEVLPGARRGRTIGFPTANLRYPEAKVAPSFGVYAVVASLADGRRVPGVANFGLRPTVASDGESEPRLEVHLFDLSEDLYGSRLAVRFIERLRSEQRFESLEALKAQISLDAERARTLLSSEPAV